MLRFLHLLKWGEEIKVIPNHIESLRGLSGLTCVKELQGSHGVAGTSEASSEGLSGTSHRPSLCHQVSDLTLAAFCPCGFPQDSDIQKRRSDCLSLGRTPSLRSI